MNAYTIALAAMISAGVPSDVAASRMTHRGGGQYGLRHGGRSYTVHAVTYPAKYTTDGHRNSPQRDANEPGAVLAIPERTSCSAVRIGA